VSFEDVSRNEAQGDECLVHHLDKKFDPLTYCILASSGGIIAALISISVL
jgi:hypothetical protein